jgi:hypothetical protein
MGNPKSVSRAMILACAAAALLGSGQVARASSADPLSALTEVMITSQQSILLALAEALGPDATSVLTFSTVTNVAGGSYSLTSAAGSTYLGMAFNYSLSGSMDSLGNTSESGSGTIGGQAIAESATGLLAGDPEYDWTDHVIINGFEYKRVGKTKVTFNPTSSSVVLENVGTGKQYNGTDMGESRPGGIHWTWLVESDPIPPKGDGIKIDASGDIDPTSGFGTFKASIEPLPEPGTVWTMLTGVFGGLACLPAMLRARRRERDS